MTIHDFKHSALQNSDSSARLVLRFCLAIVASCSRTDKLRAHGRDIDGALQAGVTWKNTVRPRAERGAQYPNAKTTSGFSRLLDELGAESLLNWHGRKLRTLRALVDVLLEQNVETEDQLLTWLEQPANRERLRQIKGIKNKTADYLAQDIAIDRHLSNFVAEAGVPTNSYGEAHQIIRDAAELLGIETATL